VNRATQALRIDSWMRSTKLAAMRFSSVAVDSMAIVSHNTSMFR
jgi:hypothetical protein